MNDSDYPLVPIDPHPQTIFRVQNELGIGPYRDDRLCHGLLNHHNENQYDFPLPKKDIGRYTLTEEKCGFLSLADLYKWFSPNEIDELKAEGYEIAQVQGLVTGIGNKQVLFTEIQGLVSEAGDETDNNQYRLVKNH